MTEKKQILMFYGEECPFCQKALKMLDEMQEKDEIPENISIEKLEVWHNEENSEKRQKYSEAIKKAAQIYDGKARINLVPCFLDPAEEKGEEKQKAICNPSKEEFKEWLEKKAKE